MTKLAKQIAEIAKNPPATDRATLANGLLASLDQPDPTIDALWIKECEDWIAAIERGELKLVDFDEAVAKLRNR